MAASKVASLQGAAINIAAVREAGRAALLEVLEAHEGSKCLILDEDMGGLLNHVLPEGPRLLKEKGVVHVNPLDANLSSPLSPPPVHFIYLVRPTTFHAKLVAAQVQRRVDSASVAGSGKKSASRLQDGGGSSTWVYFVPHRTLICEQVLKDEGVFNRVTVSECRLDFIAFEGDLLSLQMPGASADTIAQSLGQLQTIFGTIPRVRLQGQTSRDILERSMRSRKEQWDEEISQVSPEIDMLVMMDRSTDWVSALVTPLTYEGLIDELLGIENGYVKLDAAMLEQEAPEGSASEGAGQVSVPLNSEDPLFDVVRDYNIEQLGPFLQERAKEIRESYNTFRGKRDQSINQIHDFVKKIPGLTQGYKSLNQHINIAEVVKRHTDSTSFRHRWQTERSMLEGEACYEFIEEEMMSEADPLQTLRLLCLQSLTRGGISSGRFESLRRDFIQTHGFEWLPTLGALEQAGLLQKGGIGWVDSGSSWAALRKALRLINDSIDASDPDDIAYVSSGYAPLSVRLVQEASRGRWGQAADVVKHLNGPTMQVLQRSDGPETLAEALKRSNAGEDTISGNGGARDKKVMLVFYTGGVCFMEIAALRFLSRRVDFPYHIIVATTCILNGSRLLEHIAPPVKNALSEQQRD